MQSQLSFVDNGLMVYDSEENLFYYWNNNRWNAGLGVINEKNAGGDLTGTYPNPLIRVGAVKEEQISDGAISTNKLQDQSITTSKISDKAITTNKLANLSVTGAKLEDVGITPGNFGNQFTVLKLTLDSKGRAIGVMETPILITSDHIKNLSILNEDISNGSIRIAKFDPEGNTNKVLIIDANGHVQWASRDQFQTSHLLKDHLFIGNTNNQAEGMPVRGDISINSSNTSFQINESVVGSAEIINESIENEDLNKDQIPLSGFAPAVTGVNIGNNRLTNVSDPADNQDGATKHYVDESIEDLSELDEDKDPFNELNTSAQLSGTSIEITDAGGTLSIDLDPTFATDTELATAISDSEDLDLDKDETNELNTNAQLSGTSLEITDAGGTMSVDLNPTFATDTELASAITDSEALDLDKDETNELNTNAQLSGTSLEITDSGGTMSVDLDPTFATDTELASAITDSEALDLDKDATNELNTNAQLSGTSIEITDAGGTLSVDLDPTFATDTELASAITDSEALDLDKDATNELNTNAQLSGTSVEITDAGGTMSVDLNPTFATDTELASAITDSEALDLDKDETNELNTNAQLSGTSIEITDAGGTMSVDLDPTFATNTELASAITDSEALDLDKDATNELNTNAQLSGTSIEITDVGGTLSVDLDPTFTTDTELASAITDSEALDLDKDATNELNTNMNLNGTSLELTDAGGTLSEDLDDVFTTDADFYANMSSLINAFNEYAESIAFEAFLDESMTYISSGPIGFNQVVFEDGNDFYSGGHYFKAPKDGNYHFDAHLTVSFTVNQAAAISIYVDSDETGSLDGTLVAKTQLYAHNGDINSITVAKTIKLEEGNRVYIRYDGPTSTVSGGRASTTFSGHIVK
ncbi:hypothetical protein AAOE16_15575 [Ekhidna sp. MALMAid0563]|uniref:C1q-like domain-containing protein n=1 Tax=Ekhidna sp. MALMAid0563 TaxID=3143937 RepID=UPI0032DEA741